MYIMQGVVYEVRAEWCSRFMHRYKNVIFANQNTSFCGDLCYELLRLTNSVNATTRAEAGSLIYLMIKVCLTSGYPQPRNVLFLRTYFLPRSFLYSIGLFPSFVDQLKSWRPYAFETD